MKNFCNFVLKYFLVGDRTRLAVGGFFIACTLQICGSVTPCKFVIDLLLPTRSISTGSAEPFFISAKNKNEQILSEMKQPENICPQANSNVLPTTTHKTGLQTFSFEGTLGVRVLTINGEPWFIAADICRVLSLCNTSLALKPLYDEEKGVCSAYTLGGKQRLLTVSESGLYYLIFQSRKPIAKVFRKWVTSEVLPSIRKTGVYASPDLLDAKDKEIEMWKSSYEGSMKMIELIRNSCRLAEESSRVAESMFAKYADKFIRLLYKS